MEKAMCEVVLVFKIVAYFASWVIVISILCKQSTPVAAILGLGLYVISTLAIVRGEK